MNTTNKNCSSAATESNTEHLLSYLSEGRDNAVTARHLVKINAFSSIRDVTQEVNRLRRRGYIICSSCTPPCGYYLPASMDEISGFCRQMDSRITEIEKAKDAAKRLLEDGETFDP